MVSPSKATTSYKASQLEAALRRHLSSRELRHIRARPQVRPLLIPIIGTRSYPGRPCYADLESNRTRLRTIVEVWPDRIPGVYILAEAVRLLDKCYDGDILQFEAPEGNGGFVGEAYIEASVDVAAVLKTLVQRLRRLFRRSTKSRLSQ